MALRLNLRLLLPTSRMATVSSFREGQMGTNWNNTQGLLLSNRSAQTAAASEPVEKPRLKKFLVYRWVCK